MKPLTDTLKTLISEHSIDILQQEQRLKAMLADLLPYDKQMRFLLELSLRAQIPQKLIAQQNETRVGWEAQIKSMKHYFKDEYFLEDKAVESVFDCWVEVLPRKKQSATPPKLGNLNADSKFKDIGAINWVRLAFSQNANWKDFFEESKITNYKSFFNDMGVIKHANHISSYPKLVLPNSLLTEVSKQPPLEFDYQSLRESKSLFSYIESNISSEDWTIMIKLLNENRKKELSEYIAKKGLNSYFDLKTEIEKLEKESESVKSINNDKTKTVKIEQFINLGSILGYDLSTPLAPNRPSTPSKEAVPETYKKDSKSMGCLSMLIFPAIFFVILFYVLSEYYVARMILGIPLIISVLYLIGTVITGQIFTEDFWIDSGDVNVKYNANEISSMETRAKESYDKKLISYNEQLTIYNDKLIEYKNRIDQKKKDLNEVFPLIARQIWKQAIVTNTNVLSNGNTSNTVTSVNKFITRLSLLFTKHLKVNSKVFDIQSEIILNIDNNICINIEIDEPFNRETRQVNHFIGSNDEKRDGVFSENNWFVLRFTESQVTYALSECVSIVQELVQFTQSGNTQHLLNIREVSKSIEVLCWTKEDARIMALNEE